MANVRGNTSGHNIYVHGLDLLQAQFDRIGKMPTKYLTKAAKAGSNGPLKDARAMAPKGKTGLLKRGIHRYLETKNKKNKRVYRIRWNPKFTKDYLKPTTGVYGGKTPYAYYPHSQEYGFKTKYGRVEGRYFATKAVEKNQNQSLNKIVFSLNQSITSLLNKK